MHKRLIAVGLLAALLGCGDDSTGPGDNPNPNPNPQRIMVGVNGNTLTPDSLNALIGDWIIWEVNSSDTEQHRISFTTVPDGAKSDSTEILTAGQKDSASFVKAGKYRYKDSNPLTGDMRDSGVLVISPLP